MNIELMGVAYNCPTRLQDITLRQRVDFYRQYGKELDQQLKLLHETGAEESELILYQVDCAVKHVSFYAGIAIEVLRSEVAIESIMSVYLTGFKLMKEEEEAIELQPWYEYASCKWVVSAPEVKPDSGITFNEFLTSFEVIRQMQALGNGKWEALPYLCCVYFRKEGEPFNENMLKSERMELLLDLPLNIALAVGFFLSSSLHIYGSTLASSSHPEAEAV